MAQAAGLNKKDRERLLAAERHMTKAGDLILRLQNCGEDMTHFNELLGFLENKVSLWRQNFVGVDRSDYAGPNGQFAK